MSRRVLVTGASGFAGANLVRRLLRDGHQTHVILRPQHDGWRLREIISNLHVHNAALEDAATVRAVVHSAKPDWVFHLAAHGAYPAQQGKAEMISTNIVGTTNLLDACADEGVEAFIHAGSSSEYGVRDRPAREDDAPDPNSYYAITKTAASHYCRYVARTRDVNAVVLRLYSVYGPWEQPSRLIPALALHAMRGTLPRLVTPETARDFVYVDDVVDAMLLAATTEGLPRGSLLNICSGRQTTMGELVDLLRSRFAVTAEPAWGSMPARSWDTSVWCGNADLTRRTLGWRASTGPEAGLRQMIGWLQERPGLRNWYEQQRSVE